MMRGHSEHGLKAPAVSRGCYGCCTAPWRYCLPPNRLRRIELYAEAKGDNSASFKSTNIGDKKNNAIEVADVCEGRRQTIRPGKQQQAGTEHQIKGQMPDVALERLRLPLAPGKSWFWRLQRKSSLTKNQRASRNLSIAQVTATANSFATGKSVSLMLKTRQNL